MKKRIYKESHLDRVAFPMGGLGAGMLSLEGTGALSQVSFRHQPAIHHEPCMFAALFVKGTKTARVLEGLVPMWKVLGAPSTGAFDEPGNGAGGHAYGLPRFRRATFSSEFPFATVSLADPAMPVAAELTGWSPFTPGNADDSSLPVAAVEYRLRNTTPKPVRGVFSFHAKNFMSVQEAKVPAVVDALPGGFILRQPPVPETPEAEGSCAIFTDAPDAHTDAAWFRSGWWDPLTMVWNHVLKGDCLSNPPHAEGAPSQGGSLYVPFSLGARKSKTIRLLIAWHVPHGTTKAGTDPAPAAGCCAPECDCHDAGRESNAVGRNYSPWYTAHFKNIADVASMWRTRYDALRSASDTFRKCFYDTTLPEVFVDAVARNLSILKSPTCLRQADGRFWGWEGCHGGHGCCHGTCTHVWNYAQSLSHLFPELERSMRETEFLVSQDDRGHQTFRTNLPIRAPDHGFHAAADGQLGGLMKLHRDWRISGDTDWMRQLWPAAQRSLDYCIETWDPDRTGTLLEPHHNTYDIEFWGANGMCTSFYLGALHAAIAMGEACGMDIAPYRDLLAKGRKAMETTLWNGQWFLQRTQWEGLHAGNFLDFTAGINAFAHTPEALALLKKEGPKYQYGEGVLADGILGDWLARCCGLSPVVNERKTATHLASVFRHNFRTTLEHHSNTQRPGYALGKESGLLLCSWPKGTTKPSLPFPYSDEVWTGFEHHVAAHLLMTGQPAAAATIAKAAQKRYDGRWRNPFDEYECGHWYARAMSSYSLLQAYSGVRYDAVTQTLHVVPAHKKDFKIFLCTATGYGTVERRRGKITVRIAYGKIPVKR